MENATARKPTDNAQAYTKDFAGEGDGNISKRD